MKINNKLRGPGIIYHFPTTQHTVVTNYLVMLCILLNQLCLVVITAVVIILVVVLLKCMKKCTSGVKHWVQKSIFQYHTFLSMQWKEWGKLHDHIKQGTQSSGHVMFSTFILLHVDAKNVSRSIKQMWSGTITSHY